MRSTLIALVVVAMALPALAQESPSPQQLWDGLLTSNRQFVNGTLVYKNLQADRDRTATRQHPHIAVLSCADSRVPPELIFNRTIGDLFIVRAAGNIADDFGVASLEYAVANGWTKLLVVLGHEECGAVKEALTPRHEPPLTPALDILLRRIRASFTGIPFDPKNLRTAIEANTRSSAANLLADSEVLRMAVTGNRVMLVTAMYDLKSGTVRKLE